jgi:Ca-activated chloride channel family protein
LSALNPLKETPKNLKARWACLPKYLEYAALIFFLIAFIDPRLFLPRTLHPKEQPPSEFTEGIAIYLVLDQSGSMEEPIISSRGKGETKMGLLKQLTRDFIQGNPDENLTGRSNDLLGIIEFARVPNVLAPLTLDHQAVLNQLDKIHVVKDKNHDGTAIGYAIYKTANLIAATRHFAEDIPAGKGKPYDIKSTLMILVTDGVQEINPQDKGNPLRTIDIPEAAEYAKQQGVRVYIVNIDPGISAEEFAPFRQQMQHAVEANGGKFFMMNDARDLSKIYGEIDRLEKSKLPENAVQSISKSNLPQFFIRHPLYPFFIALGMICLLLSILLKSTWMRQMP